MTALTDNLEAKRQDGEIIEYPVLAAEVIYKGALVVDKGTGFAAAGDQSASTKFLGVAVEKSDNSASGASDGDTKVRVYKTGVFQYTMPSAADTDRGVPVYVRDDQTVDSSVTNSVFAGYVVDIVSSSLVKLRIDGAVDEKSATT